jgi:hypothetical protein
MPPPAGKTASTINLDKHLQIVGLKLVLPLQGPGSTA